MITFLEGAGLDTFKALRWKPGQPGLAQRGILEASLEAPLKLFSALSPSLIHVLLRGHRRARPAGRFCRQRQSPSRTPICGICCPLDLPFTMLAWPGWIAPLLRTSLQTAISRHVQSFHWTPTIPAGISCFLPAEDCMHAQLPQPLTPAVPALERTMWSTSACPGAA